MSFDPFTDAAIADPYPQYARLRAEDPVHWSDKLQSWIVFRYDDVVAFFRDDERLSSDRAAAAKFRGPRPPEGTPALRTVSSDPPDHAPVRAILAASLGPRVRAIGPRVDTLIDALLQRIGLAAERAAERAAQQPGEVDLIADFAAPLPITVIAELLGIPIGDREQFAALSHAIARGMDRFYSGGAAADGLRELGAYFLQLLGERRAAPGDDLMRGLLTTDHRGDHLSDLEVVAMCAGLVFAGHETTVNLIGNGLLALLRVPASLEALRAEPPLIEPAVEELLRFDSPAQFISRTARVDFDWRTRTIRSGDSVLAGLGAANRDPAAFDAPDRLDLRRAPNPHVAFGLGIHICPGAQLSRIEARAAIPALLRRFPRLRLSAQPPVHRRTAVLRGLEHLPVRVD